MEVVEKFRGSHGALSKRGKFRVTARETGALHTEVELGERLRSRHTLLPRTPRQEQDPPPPRSLPKAQIASRPTGRLSAATVR